MVTNTPRALARDEVRHQRRDMLLFKARMMTHLTALRLAVIVSRKTTYPFIVKETAR